MALTSNGDLQNYLSWVSDRVKPSEIPRENGQKSLHIPLSRNTVGGKGAMAFPISRNGLAMFTNRVIIKMLHQVRTNVNLYISTRQQPPGVATKALLPHIYV